MEEIDIPALCRKNGNPEKNAALAVAVDDDDMENSVVSDSFKAITAVIRVNIYKHWNYDGARRIAPRMLV